LNYYKLLKYKQYEEKLDAFHVSVTPDNRASVIDKLGNMRYLPATSIFIFALAYNIGDFTMHWATTPQPRFMAKQLVRRSPIGLPVPQLLYETAVNPS
jgi:hypothetical protein